MPPEDTQFKPGPEWKGNRSGRPKSRHITNAIRRELARFAREIPDEPGPDDTVQTVMVRALLKRASAGDVRHIREVIDRVEGKAVQAIDLQGQAGVTVDVIQAALEVREKRKRAKADD
jgi:hypothetical protein